VNPWIKVINDTAIAVNQLGARAGSISVTLDVWHRDIYDFLDLQTETGDIRRKAFDIFPSVSMPDLFMKRVEEDGDWTLFDPLEVTKLTGKKLQDHF
jgi:ribonucleoside-diphosphate reductase alpha chain